MDLTFSESTSSDILEFCLVPWTAYGDNDVTEQQVAAAARISWLLVSAKRFEVFDKLVSSFPELVLKVFLQNERFRRSLIDLKLHQGKHEEVCSLVKDGYFTDGSDLIEVWDNAQYRLWEARHRKPLSALNRFRIRKRNPPPASICQHGRLTRSLESKARAVLSAWFSEHASHPYPTVAEREQVARKTGLTHTQIRTWFANARRRQQRREDRDRVAQAKVKGSERQAGGCNSPAKRLAEKSENVGEDSGQKNRKQNSVTSSSLCRMPQRPQAAVCHVTSTPYLQLTPAPLGNTEYPSLQSLMQMYNRLASQTPGTPNSLATAGQQPYSCLYPSTQRSHHRPSPLQAKFQQWGSNPSRGYGHPWPGNQPHKLGGGLAAVPMGQIPAAKPVQELTMSSSVDSSGPRIPETPSSSLVQMKQSPLFTSFSLMSSSVEGSAWGSGDSHMSMPSSPLTSTTAVSAARMEFPLERGVAIPPDHFLSPWNLSSSWLASSQGPVVSNHSAYESYQDPPEPMSYISQENACHFEGLPFLPSVPSGVLYKDHPLPQAMETLVLQKLQNTSSGSVITSSPMRADMVTADNVQSNILMYDWSTQSSDGLVNMGGQMDEEAAHILLDLATTKTS